MKTRLILLAALLPLIMQGQPVITLRQAIDTTLKNNFDIRIARNNLEINKANNTFGVAGGLPSVTASAGDNQTLTNIYQKLNNGTEIKKNNAGGNAMTSNVTAGITLFNGFKVLATKERLDCLQKQSEIQLNNQIQNSMANVMVKYYDIIRQQEYLKILQTSRDVSQQKLDIIVEKQKAGMASEVDYLQSMIDLNTADQSVKNQKVVVEQAKTDLLQLMAVKSYYAFNVTDSILVDKSLQLSSIESYLSRNPQYLSAEQQVRINEMVVKEVSAIRYPSLKLSTGVNLNRSQNAAGFTLINQNLGPFAGLSLQVPIYNGNAYKIQKDVAMYNVSSAKLQKESLMNLLQSDAIKTYQSYSTQLQQLEAQEKTIAMASKLLDVVIQRFRVNQSTILDVKAAQSSYENSGYQLVNLQYAAKVAEIELKKLMYKLEN